MPMVMVPCTLNAEIGVSTPNSEADGIGINTTGPGEGVRGLFQFDISNVKVGFYAAKVSVRQKFAGLTTWHLQRLVTSDWTANATWDTYDGSAAWTAPGGDFVESTSIPAEESGMRSSAGLAYLDVNGHLIDAVAASLATLNILLKQVDESILTNNGTTVDSIEDGIPATLIVYYSGESRRPFGNRPYNNRPHIKRPASRR